MSAPVTLLISNSIDFVSDLIVENLGSDRVFRYNTDLWQDYRLSVADDEIEIENPAGRRVTERDIAKVYRRSNVRASTLYPDREMSTEDRFAEEEVWTAWNDLFNIFHAAGKVVLNQPLASLRMGKLQQARIARKYFQTTPARFLINSGGALRDCESVVKSFTFKFETGVGFYTQTVRESELDPRFPWYLSDFVKADRDVTVAFVRDELFAFALDRGQFIGQTIDWRQAPSEYAHRGWHTVELPPGIVQGVIHFMAEVGGHYARVDFLQSGDDYTFLEANFTGEWGWLDAEGKHGLRDKILAELDPRTPVHSVPRFAPV